jgi:hypothetical protein
MRTVFNLKFFSGAHACAYRFTDACAYSCIYHPCRLIVYRCRLIVYR